VLARLNGPERLEAGGVFQFAAQLTSMTEWPEEQLLKALGCTLKTIGEFEGADLERFRRCGSFLRLVTRDVGLVDTVADRRQLVAASSRLLKAIGGNVDYLDRLLKAKVGDYTAIDLIRMGEIESAGDQVRRLAKADGVGQAIAPDDPFAAVAPVHLSSTRIDMLIQGREDALGAEVASYMRCHIKECDGCRNAYDYRAARITA
jgi:hypothetical protein